jgi:Glycosyltransferase family 9 (heptosyltransferase)
MTASVRHHPIFGLPFAAPVATDLESEYRRLTRWQQASAMRKVLQRELFSKLIGQARLELCSAPLGTRRVLWIYGWQALGDSLMDLAVRVHLPRQIAIDLLISPSLQPLYADDPFFRAVRSEVEDCAGDYDFVLLQHMNVRSLRLKLQVARNVAFASVFGHLNGERFDRMGFAQRRMEQLFLISPREPAAQHLHVAAAAAVLRDRIRVCVALGAKDQRRAYEDWPDVLRLCVEGWPTDHPRPLFVLMGDASALRDLQRFPSGFLDRHCQVEAARVELRGAVASMSSCDAFVGMDGGLMHVAAALAKPGLAIFSGIDPRMRLRPNARMRALCEPDDARRLRPSAVAAALLAAIFSHPQGLRPPS